MSILLKNKNNEAVMNHQEHKILISKIHNAIDFLADACDYARSKDGAGFSGVDTSLGHALAEKAEWSKRESIAAARLVVKYQKQCGRSKVDIEIPAVKDFIEMASKEEGSGPRRRLKKRDVVRGEISLSLWARKAMFVIKTSYHEELKEEIKALIGSEWDEFDKIWVAPPCEENALALRTIAEKYGITLIGADSWGELPKLRAVYIENDRVVVKGVSARRLREKIGNPGKECVINLSRFFAARIQGDNFSFPRTSWNVGKLLLWLETVTDPAIKWMLEPMREALEPHIESFRQRELKYAHRSNALEASKEVYKKLSAHLPEDFAKRLMPHQWVGIQVLAENNQSILADEQGLGKTIEILGALEATQSFPAVILCPATARLNWRDETASWLPHRKVSVLGGNIAKSDKGSDLFSADLIIVNYEGFKKVAGDLNRRRPMALVADEAQYLKGHDSGRTEEVSQFLKDCKIQKTIMATGTPILNRPSELMTLLTLLPDMLDELGGFWHFAGRYCGAEWQTRSMGPGFWNMGGADNLDELARRLKESGRFVRREKSAVLAELPEKQIEITEVELVNAEEYAHAETDFKEWLKAKIKKKSKMNGDEETTRVQMAAEYMGLEGSVCLSGKAEKAEALRRMTALRQLCGRGKIESATQTIQKIVKDEKLVVFAYHVEVQEALLASLNESGLQPLAITGEMKAAKRRQAIADFQTNEDARVIVCSQKAAQTAITLTAAKRAIFVELDWTPANLEQAEDRIHRIGQSKQVVITYLVGRDALDGRMSQILTEKRKIIKSVFSAEEKAVAAPYGYKKDGTPRLQEAGPGRRPLPEAKRKANREVAQANWQAKNPEYMKIYMREWRKKRKEQIQIK